MFFAENQGKTEFSVFVSGYVNLLGLYISLKIVYYSKK